MTSLSDQSAEKIIEKPEKDTAETGLPPNLEALKKQGQQTKIDTVSQASGIKLDILKTEVDRQPSVPEDTETLEKLKNRDHQTLEIVSYSLLTVLFEKLKNPGSLEKLKDFTEFAKFQLPSDIQLSVTERTAFEILQEISKEHTSSDFKIIESKWKNFIGKFQKIYKKAEKEASGFNQKPVENNSILSWIQKNPGKSMLMVSGAYGLYKILKKPVAENKKSSWGMKALFAGGTLAVGTVVLGKYLGKDEIKNWLIHITSKTVWQEFKLQLEKGEYLEAAKIALKALFEGSDKNAKHYQTLAEKISDEMKKTVDAKTIQAIANAPYESFMSTTHEAKSYLAAQASAIPLLGAFFEKNPAQINQESTLRAYLEKHKTEIHGGKTVFEALAHLNDINIEENSEKNKNLQNKEKTEDLTKAKEDLTEAIETGTGEIVGVSDVILNSIKEELKGKKYFCGFIEKYEGNWNKSFLDASAFWNDFYAACKKDGLGVILTAGKIILVEGEKFILFTSAKAFYEGAKTVAEAPFSDEIGWSDAITNYTETAIPFMIIGAGYGALAAKSGFAAKLEGFAKGAGKGFVFPLTAAKLHYEAGSWVYRTSQESVFQIRNFFSAEEMRPRLLEQQMLTYAKNAEGFGNLQSLQEHGSLLNPKAWYAKFSKERIVSLKSKYIYEFAQLYNELEKIKDTTRVAAGEQSRFTELRATTPEEQHEAMKKIQEILRDAKTTPAGNVKTQEPVLQKSKEINGKKHQIFRYENASIALSDEEIALKTEAIEQNRINKGEKSANTDTASWNEQNRIRAIQALCEEKFSTPAKTGANEYALQGQKFHITPEQIKTRMAAHSITEIEAVKDLCYEEALKKVTIQDIELKDGKYRYRIEVQGHSEWIETENPSDPAKQAEIREKFQKVLKEKNVQIDIKKLMLESKIMGYFSVLEKIMGTAAAVWTIYQLETAKDKKKAVADVAAGFGIFYAGQKGAAAFLSRTVALAGKLGSSLPKSPYTMAATTVLAVSGGLLAAYGIKEPVGTILEDALDSVVEVGARHGVANEMAEMMNSYSYRYLGKMSLRLTEKQMIKGLEKAGVSLGFRGIEKYMQRSILKEFNRKIVQFVVKFAAEKGFLELLKRSGWKGAITAATLADDATVIGVLDDFIAIIFGALTIKDIYDIRKLIVNAKKIEEEMKKRSGKKIIQVTGGDRESDFKLNKALEGKKLSELSEEEVQHIIHSLPQLKVKIQREGIPGYELWSLEGGTADKSAKAVGIKIIENKNGKDEIIAEINNEDAAEIDEKVKEMEDDSKKLNKKPQLSGNYRFSTGS